MRIFYLLFLMGLILSVQVGQAFPGKVRKAYTAPSGFCTGLTFDGKLLWVADHKADKLFAVDPASGEMVRSLPSPGFWPMGLAWDGEHLWNVDLRQKKIFQVDPQSGRILRVLDAPSDNPEGLTWDGHTLWVSDPRSDEIMKIDLNDGTAVQTFRAPANYVQGLTFDGTYLWCADRLQDELYMIDPSSGEVILVLTSPGKYPRGLAWDGKFLWCVDYQSDSLYQLVRQDEEMYRLRDTRKARITFTHEAKVYGQGNLQSLDVYVCIPENLPQQRILSIRYDPADPAVVTDHWGQKFAHFSYINQPSETTLRSTMVVEAEISAIDYFIFPEKCGTLKDIPEDIRKRYTADGSKYLLSDPYIQKLAREIVGDETNPYWIARKIFNYVREHLEYKLEGGWNVAPVVLKRGTGSCSEYTFSFIALCRAAGVPARYVGSIVVRGDDASLDDVFHRWPEVYLPHYGWVPMDPQGGDKPLPRDQAMNIGHLSNRFLITTRGGGDSKFLGWYYNSYETYQCDPQVQVNIETFGEWEPMQ